MKALSEKGDYLKGILASPEDSDEEIQTLQILGLTLNQARIYLALVTLKAANAKTLSKSSGLAACDVYRTMNELLNIGLAEALVTSPKEFRATPAESAMQILLNRKKKNIEEIEKRAENFVSQVKCQAVSEPNEDSKMALIPPGDRSTQFGTPILLETKERLDCVQTNVLFQKFIKNSVDALLTLLKKDVKVRFVVESEQAIERPSEEVAAIIKNRNVTIKFAKEKIAACILLHDASNVFISTSTDTIHSPSYWSSNSCIIEVARSYFESVWKDASSVPTNS